LKFKTVVVKKNKMVIFDFDGVIVDSIGVAFETMQHFTPSLTSEDFESHFYQNIFAHKNVNPPYSASEFYAKYTPQVELLPIAVEMCAATVMITPRKKQT